LGGRKRASGLSENPIRRKIEWWTGFPDERTGVPLRFNLNYEVAPWMSPAKAGWERLLGAI
jgi:hypothetical protein